MRLWAPRAVSPGRRAVLSADGVVLSRETFESQERTLSREANAHGVAVVSSTHLELWANPEAQAPLLVVQGWHFGDFQEGLASPQEPWPVRPSELSKPHHVVLAERRALGLFRAVTSEVRSLPIHLVPLPSARIVKPGERLRLEPPFTVVVGEAAAEFVAARTLAPPEGPTLRGPIGIDVGVLSARLSMAQHLDDAVLRFCVPAPKGFHQSRGAGERTSSGAGTLAHDEPLYRFSGSKGQHALAALFPLLRRELERHPDEPWMMFPVLGPAGEAQLALTYRSRGEVRVLLSTAEVDRFVEELERLLTEHQPLTRSTPWSDGGLRSPRVRRSALSVPRRFGALATRSLSMASVLDELESVAPSEIRVLLLGETGTGKDFAAREIHKASRRAKAPFVACNLGSISPQLIDSELFGHVKGAFTGATSDRPGLFREADGGTLFLDEIGDASAQTQTALLRVLEAGCVRTVGTDRETPVNVRLIAATSRDLDAAQESGSFRPDLYHRLLGIAVRIPPLRDRLEDLPELTSAILDELFAEAGGNAEEDDAPRVTAETLDAMSEREWPGNVRELRTTLQAGMVRAQGAKLLGPSHLFPPPRARILREDGSEVQVTRKPPALSELVSFSDAIVELAQESIRNKALCRSEDASRRVARATARAAALYLRIHAPSELTGTLGRDATRLFQPDWAETDEYGMRALLHQLNEGAPRPTDFIRLTAVLASVGWS